MWAELSIYAQPTFDNNYLKIRAVSISIFDLRLTPLGSYSRLQ